VRKHLKQISDHMVGMASEIEELRNMNSNTGATNSFFRVNIKKILDGE
jgi:hypothetical protein